MAVNIQRGRDHGLPDYNTAREAYGLRKKNSFLEIKASDSNIEDSVCEICLMWILLLLIARLLIAIFYSIKYIMCI